MSSNDEDSSNDVKNKTNLNRIEQKIEEMGKKINEMEEMIENEKQKISWNYQKNIRFKKQINHSNNSNEQKFSQFESFLYFISKELCTTFVTPTFLLVSIFISFLLGAGLNKIRN